jgi:formyl-CoA transferase
MIISRCSKNGFLSEPPGKIKSPAPDLGQHNAEVYKEFLGMSEADVEELKKERVI